MHEELRGYILFPPRVIRHIYHLSVEPQKLCTINIVHALPILPDESVYDIANLTSDCNQNSLSACMRVQRCATAPIKPGWLRSSLFQG